MSRLVETTDWGLPENTTVLQELHKKIASAFPGATWYFVRIIGRRWSYLCGERDALAAAPERIRLTDNLGICIFGAAAIQHETCRKIEKAVHQGLKENLPKT